MKSDYEYGKAQRYSKYESIQSLAIEVNEFKICQSSFRNNGYKDGVYENEAKNNDEWNVCIEWFSPRLANCKGEHSGKNEEVYQREEYIDFRTIS